ncbi:MAG: metallophosphoesterase [Methanocellales archaeon]|nr:metallophosphoesterase [Methanocellales archaeon]
MKTYCISDTHIGFEHSHYKAIARLLKKARKDADELILCGDILDLWRCPLPKIKKDPLYSEAYFDLLNTMKEVPSIYIRGNHDIYIQKTGFPFPTVGKMMEDGIYYTHGWEFDLMQRLGSPLYYWLVTHFPYLYQKFFRTPSQIRTEEDPYNRLVGAIHAEARIFAEKRGYDKIVIGHTHQPFMGDHIVYDCGDLIDSLSYLIIEDGVPVLHKMRK